MNEEERQALAERLANMKYQRARSQMRKLDPQARLKHWRNSVNMKEWHTTYELPTIGIRVILVERPETKPKEGTHLVRSKPVYIEARVEPLVTA